jgi:hypothetical protein
MGICSTIVMDTTERWLQKMKVHIQIGLILIINKLQKTFRELLVMSLFSKKSKRKIKSEES